MNRLKVTKHSRILWALAALPVAALLALWWGNRPEYVRYVSRPLKDGSRFTFLYLTRMNRVADRSSTLRMTVGEVHETTTLWQRALGTLRARSRGMTFHSQPVYGSAFTVEPMPLSRLKYRQAGRAWMRHEPANIDRRVVVADQRSRTLFLLTHWAPGGSIEEFKREDKVIIGSFRVLPPGAPEP